MDNGKLSETDVTTKTIHLDNSVRDLFKNSKGETVTIVEKDSKCQFSFKVKKGQLIQENSNKNKKKTLKDKDKDFFNLFVLEKGDEIIINHGDGNGCFDVEIKEKTGQNVVSMDEHEKEKLIDVISKTYTSIKNEYNRIFNTEQYLPTKASRYSINGFTERNLTFNFCHSYLDLMKQEHEEESSNAIVWQEVPINNTNGEHIDSIIIDKDNNWVIYLEAKRFYDIHHFKYLLDDLKRIKKKHSDIPLPYDPNSKSPLKKVVILLADHIYDGKKENEKDFYNKFFTGQKNYKLPEIDEKKYPNLKKILPSMIEAAKITTISNKIPDNSPDITIERGKKYNIDIKDNIVYSIYCGVYFIDGTKKK